MIKKTKCFSRCFKAIFRVKHAGNVVSMFIVISNHKFQTKRLWPPAHVTAVTSKGTSCSHWLLCGTNQKRRSVWILWIFPSGTWLVKEFCGGQPLHHIFFSGIVLPKNNAMLALDFLEFPHPSSHQAIKLRNVPRKGTACLLDQSIQWTGRRGTWHLYAIIQAISICTVKGEAEVWC